MAAFDSFMAQVAKELVRGVPLTARRRARLSTLRFHNLSEACATFKEWFDIDVWAGMIDGERGSVALMFFRRHVYEHNGGEVDQKYLDDSGDTTVRLKQHIHETREDAHRLLSSLVKMARNVHSTFHELFPPNRVPIKAFEDKKERMAKYARGTG